MSISATLGSSGEKRTFTHNGKTYTLSLIKQRIKAAFEDWLRGKALAGIMHTQGMVPPETWERSWQSALDSAATKFAWNSRATAAALQTHAGQVKLASLVFNCTEDEMIELMKERLTDIDVELAQIRLLSFGEVPQPDQENADPNSPPPAV